MTPAAGGQPLQLQGLGRLMEAAIEAGKAERLARYGVQGGGACGWRTTLGVGLLTLLESASFGLPMRSQPDLGWAGCSAVEQGPLRLSGAWVFRSTRIPVAALFENLEDGVSLAEFVELFPGVTRQQARLVLEHALRQASRQISRHPKDLPLALLRCDQQAAAGQLLQITAGRLVAYAMAALVREHRVAEAGVP